jgi:hypothetical protein
LGAFSLVTFFGQAKKVTEAFGEIQYFNLNKAIKKLWLGWYLFIFK